MSLVISAGSQARAAVVCMHLKVRSFLPLCLTEMSLPPRRARWLLVWAGSLRAFPVTVVIMAILIVFITIIAPPLRFVEWSTRCVPDVMLWLLMAESGSIPVFLSFCLIIKAETPSGFQRGRKVCVVVRLLSRVQPFVTPWTAGCQTSLSFTISLVC